MRVLPVGVWCGDASEQAGAVSAGCAISGVRPSSHEAHAAQVGTCREGEGPVCPGGSAVLLTARACRL